MREIEIAGRKKVRQMIKSYTFKLPGSYDFGGCVLGNGKKLLPIVTVWHISIAMFVGALCPLCRFMFLKQNLIASAHQIVSDD